jgi:hypothetical protein
MGIGGLRTHIRIVPICGTFLPVNFGPSLLPPELGPFLLDVAQAKRGDTLQLPLMDPALLIRTLGI